MSYTIEVQANSYIVDKSRLIQAAETVLDHHIVDRTSSLTIVFHDDEEQHKLNASHRQIDTPTDILSFPADPLPEGISDEPPYLGDLVIAYPYTSNVAERHNTDLADVFCLLVIHGTLHLLGYDHLTDDDKTEMWSAQADALKTMNIDPIIVDQYGGELDA